MDWIVRIIHDCLRWSFDRFVPQHWRKPPTTDGLPSTAAIAGRMRRVLRLMNERRSDDELTVSDLAKAMSLESPSQLDRVMRATIAPSFEFLHAFAERFAVNREWLTTGRGHPFHSDERAHHLPEDYYERIIDSSPNEICFVRSSGAVGEAVVILGLDDYRYILLPSVWHISEHVGGSGCMQIYSLYGLVRRLWTVQPHISMHGRVISARTFKQLSTGTVWPGTVVHDAATSHWWDDLTDLDNRWTKPEACRRSYGSGFVFAQNVIRQKLNERND